MSIDELVNKFEDRIVKCRKNHTDFASQYCVDEAIKLSIEFTKWCLTETSENLDPDYKQLLGLMWGNLNKDGYKIFNNFLKEYGETRREI